MIVPSRLNPTIMECKYDVLKLEKLDGEGLNPTIMECKWVKESAEWPHLSRLNPTIMECKYVSPSIGKNKFGIESDHNGM